MAYIELKHVYKFFDVAGNKIVANDDINLSINEGELVIIVGASGAGKTTLLNLIGGMDTISKGEIKVDEKNLSNMSEKELTKYRRDDVGFVFQFYNLIPNLTSIENVELSSEIAKDNMDAGKALESVGLKDRKNSFPSQLSGGEQQRVAIARAIAKNPKILLCDEPTGALDYETGKQVLKILQNMSRENNATVVIVTHNSAIAPIADRVIKVRNASVESIEINPKPANVMDLEW